LGLSDLRVSDLRAFDDLWLSIPDSRRRSTVRSLVDLSESVLDADFTVLFRHCLADPDPTVRSDAIDGLWESQDAWLVDALIAILRRDVSETARAAAAETLGRFVLLGELSDIDVSIATRVEEALLATLARVNEMVEVRRRALESIAYSGSPDVESLVRQAYESEDPDLRVSALCAMGRSANRSWRSVLKEELASSSAAARYEAALACGELELQDTVDHLIQLVQDDDPEVRWAAVEALGKIGGRTATQILQTCCEAEDETLSSAAREALETMAWDGELQLDILDDWRLGSDG